MEKFLNGDFFNPTKGNLKINQVIGEILDYIQEKPENSYEVIIGCDSSSGEDPHFPVVTVILRKGEGGRFFLKKISYKNRKFYYWKERILEEVLLSCEFALFLREKLQEEINKLSFLPSFEFRYIHADIGGAGQTKDAVKELTGLMRCNGFEPKIKPESFAACNVADRFT